ncbi:Glutathione hydrolase 1 proenzyme [Halotydeus destructor]|nr:Glutathione hydrolase 1 proenzyme [Halotydeus destructor]
MKRQYVAALALIAVVLVILISLLYKNRVLTATNYLGHHVSPTPLGQYSQAAVVSDAEQCAAIGRQLLEKNGTAMDAAIGTLFCMGVVIPQSMGLGGGCFITFYNSTSRKATVIDGRESAPLASSENMYDGNLTLAQRGPLAIAVPGELAAYAEGHRLFGRLSWADLTKGAERLAEQGFRVGKHFESSLKRWEDTIPKYNVKDVILKQNGDPFVEGDTLKRPDLGPDAEEDS